ncbi:MAG: TonB-dependent receptor [Pseudomonadota bacterium]
MEQSPDRVIIKAADIERLDVQTIQDLLNLVPGVQADSSTVTIRGSNSVRVLLDGLLLNSALTAGSTIKWNLVSLPAVAEVVIRKGSGAVEHGDDSSGGVITITTKRMQSDRGYAQVSFGGFGIQDHQAGASRAAPDWGLRADAAYYHSDGFRLNNDKTIWRLNLKSSIAPAAWAPAKAAGTADDLSLGLNYSLTERGLPGLPAFPNPQARERQRDFGASLAFKHLGVSSGTYLTNFRNDFSNPPKHLFTELESWAIRQELKSQAAPGVLGPLGWGVSLQDRWARGNSISAVAEQSYGVYATKKVAVSSLPVKLNLGLRHNGYSNFDPVLNPEADLALNLGRLSLRGGVSVSNNVPTFLQRYYRNSSTEPNPDLDLERSTNYSVGASYQPAPGWQAELTLYDNLVKDRITFILGNNGVGRYENVGEARLEGVDLSLTGNPWQWLRLQVAYGYLDAKDLTTDRWLPGKSRHSARLDLQIAPTAKSLAGAKVSYYSPAFTRADNTDSAGSYCVVDLRGEISWQGLRLFAKLDNCLDEEYLTGDGYPGSPRTWQVGLVRDF